MAGSSTSVEMKQPGQEASSGKAKDLRKGIYVMGVLLAATLVAIVLFLLFATGTIKTDQGSIEITKSLFGHTSDETRVEKYTMTNSNGMSVGIMTLGGTMTSIRVPDSLGLIDDVILGFDTVAGYESDMNPYFGSLVGRYANRIANGTFTIDDVTYSVTLNTYGDPPQHHLHGGVVGWNKYVWGARVEDQSLILNLTSPDGDQGFPGEVQCEVIFTLTEDSELHLEFRASVTGKATPINLTSHPYFNLGGHNSGDVYDHDVQINADDYLPIAEDVIPTGEIASVTGTLFDLRQMVTLGSVIGDDFNGYDHNFCLFGTSGKRLAASVSHPGSGRRMDIYTDQPGVQFYTGNFVGVDGQGKDGASYHSHSGLCLETQNYPDAPNHDNFPDSILHPGSVYIHNVWFKFSA